MCSVNRYLNSVLLDDDAYSLKINVLKPYSRLNLTYEEWIFNYCTSRVLRCIECAFSIFVCYKWRCLKTELQISPENVGILLKYIISSSLSKCSAQGQVLHCKRRNLGRYSAEGRSSTANSGNKAAVIPGIE